MAEVYYFISDLHIGGDGVLDECAFESELTALLRRIEMERADTELIIVGDMFGLWETTYAEGPDKLHGIIASHTGLFMQFRRAGARARITVIPGNHDHELATHPEFAAILSVYNIHLEAKEYITREIAGRGIWIEHGNQHDSYNRFDDFGNPACRPLGYYVTSGVIRSVSRRVQRRNQRWLQDIEAVYPTEHVPYWLLSNYFYREMSLYIRLLILPFLLLFSTSVILAAGVLLEIFGAVRAGTFLSSFTYAFGRVGYVLDALFLVNGAAVAFILVCLVPMVLVRRDMKSVLTRYGIDLSEALTIEKESQYHQAAERVFREHPEMAVYAFGHTHGAGALKTGDRVILNTGTWIRKLTCIPSRFYLLPDVYCASYHLGYFRICASQEGIRIEHHRIPKSVDERLSLLQRFSIYGKRHDSATSVPALIVLPSLEREGRPEDRTALPAETEPLR